MKFSLAMYYFIAVLSMLNFIRICAMLLASDIYDIRQNLSKRRRKSRYNPLVTIIIPAYNEETGVLRTVKSVVANSYKNKEIIVVNDGSKDKTKSVVRNYQNQNPGQVRLVNQPNGGKAAAINRAINKWAKGQLIMVLDADSLLKADGIGNMVEHFRDRRVIASASNVKIIPSSKLYGISQQIEYLISYRMKRALNVLNMEYIVGGVGSTFRKSAIDRVGGFDTDTMTEDIDLTLKLINQHGNSKYRVHYAADCVAYTEHVMSFKSLIRQRYRWKYGRFQTLLKNRKMFFSRSAKYDKKLTWYQLPYAIFGEMILFLEPLLVSYILYVVVLFSDLTSLIWVYVIVTAFVFLLFIGEDTDNFKTKARLAPFLPMAYFLMYTLTAVELFALYKSIKQSRALFRQDLHAGSWEHVERSGQAVSL